LLFRFLYNRNTIVKKTNNDEIPKVIYQTWHTKKLPINMKKCVEKLKKNNPNYQYHLYDDNDCKEFIQQYFNDDVIEAFDKLKPGAFKADLWRYCILYIKGGIYLDIKYEPINNFSFNYLQPNKEYFVLERPGFWEKDSYGIYNALMICKPNNNILLNCIRQIVKNVKNNYYGMNALYPTGPGLLGKMYFNVNTIQSQMNEFEMNYDCNKYDLIFYKNQAIFKNYDEYRMEQKKNSKQDYYVFLWINKDIYFL
jgi:mannosyltransferase OCH1-like enzyme